MAWCPPLARLRPRDEFVYISCNRSVLSTARDGFIHGEGQQGLFVFQTRLLSLYRYSIDGKRPEPAGLSNIEEHSQIAYYVVESPNPDEQLLQGALGPGGKAATQAIELRLSRFVGDGLQEEVAVSNHTQKPACFSLDLEIDADFADPNETHGARKQHGQLERQWRTEDGKSELSWSYTAEHEYQHQGDSGKAVLRRGAKASISQSGAPPEYRQGDNCIRFSIELPPHGIWRASVLVSAIIDGRTYEPARHRDFASTTPFQEKRDRFLAEAAQLDAGVPPLAPVVHRAVEQARRDLAGFRLYDLDREGGWVMAAGLPVYIAFFGRDTIITSWMASLLGRGMARGTLAHLAETQADHDDDWRDAQPGRFVHQIETGPLAALRFNPHGCYYGALTSPGLYPVLLADLWHWTGDLEVVRQFLDPARKGLAWLEAQARHDRGFYSYRTRSEQGVKNQAWKDSHDAIVYPDGRQVPDPIAPTEFQAYAFAAKLGLSEMLWWMGQRDESRKLFDEAIELRKRFNDAFWIESEGCFGMGLDPSGDLIRSVGSESAHALATGIVAHERVDGLTARLFRPDLFSGWGLRTLSARHPAFNPFSYHRGSVWPAEQAVFCAGLMRYGLHEQTHRVAQAQFEAASIFEYHRLPELFSGHQRDDEHPVPALYPNADSPQAWSSAATVRMVHTMLGLFPYAPLRALFLDPHLPDWLPELHVRRVRVGEATADLRFHRTGDGKTHSEVLGVRGKLHIVRQPSPWSHTATFTERLVDALTSVLPGR